MNDELKNIPFYKTTSSIMLFSIHPKSNKIRERILGNLHWINLRTYENIC